MITWSLYKEGKQIGEICYFPDFITQAYLLHIFDVGAKDLDEYGSWIYDREDMLRLKIILENWIERHEMAIDRVIQVQTIPEGDGEIQISNVIRLMEATCSMIDKGLSIDAVLWFGGD